MRVVLKKTKYYFEEEDGEIPEYIHEYTVKHLIADMLVKPIWWLAWKLRAPWRVIKTLAKMYYKIIS